MRNVFEIFACQLGFAFVSSILLDIRILCEAHVRLASLRWDSSLFAFHHCLLWLFETFLYWLVIGTLEKAESTFHCIKQFQPTKSCKIIRFQLGPQTLATAEIHSPEGTCPRFVSGFQG